jgi:hypothetical protein
MLKLIKKDLSVYHRKKRGRKVHKMQNGSADPTKELLEELKKDETLKERIIDYLTLLKQNSRVPFETIKQGHKFTKPENKISQIKDILFSKPLKTFLDRSFKLPVTTVPDSSYFKCKYLGGKYETLNESNEGLEIFIEKWLNTIINGKKEDGTTRNCNTNVIPNSEDKISFMPHDLYTLVRFYEMVRYQAKRFFGYVDVKTLNTEDEFISEFLKYFINDYEISIFLNDNKNVLKKFLPHFMSDISVDDKITILKQLSVESDFFEAGKKFEGTHIAIEWQIAHDIKNMATCSFKNKEKCYKSLNRDAFLEYLTNNADLVYPAPA